MLWHSVMWQYVPDDERALVLGHVERAGALATARSPLAYVRFEPRRPAPGAPHEFVVAARTWPGGDDRVLGSAPPHGVPVTWRDAVGLA